MSPASRVVSHVGGSGRESVPQKMRTVAVPFTSTNSFAGREQGATLLQQYTAPSHRAAARVRLQRALQGGSAATFLQLARGVAHAVFSLVDRDPREQLLKECRGLRALDCGGSDRAWMG